MTRRTSLVAAVALLVSVHAASAVDGPAVDRKISPALDKAFAESADGSADMLVVLAEQADLSPTRYLIRDKDARGAFVVARLMETAKRTQAALLAELESLGVPARPFWAANFVVVHGDAALARRLAQRTDVARIDPNPTLVVERPVDESVDWSNLAPDAVEWNIVKVNADDVWALGYTGQGAVIAGEDTGYDWDHPALKAKYRGWNGVSANHNYNWHDAIHSGGGVCGANSTQPCDDDTHGTHTMGTMVGDDGGANQIGMAPGAKWIGCRNMNQGAGTPETYIECFQWFLAPTDLAGNNPDPTKAPHVINNSWGCPASEGCNPGNFAVMQQVVENLRAAGIFVVVSAGNDGSGCSTVNTPAAIYDAVFAVGSTTSSDSISSFSSRGPVTVDGSNRMKPDISAPGSGIRSSLPGTGYGSKDGTSMAGPHVAGLVALLISAAPDIAGDVDLLEDVIRQTAFHPTFTGACGIGNGVFPNNTFGAGRIDALAAVNALCDDELSIRATPTTRSVCAPNDAIFALAVVSHCGVTDNVTLSVSGLPAGVSPAFSVNPVTPTGASTLTLSGTGAAAAGTYPLNISGNNGTLTQNAAVTLRIFTGAAGTATLTAPANGATNVAIRPTFTWGAVATAESYLLEVDDDAGFATPLLSQAVAGTSFTPAADLPSNTHLYWRVTAINPCASTASATFDFTTVPLPGDCSPGFQTRIVYGEGFEAGAAGWTSAGTGNTWAISTTSPHGGTSHHHATDPNAVSDQALLSPVAGVALPVGESPLVLSFWHRPDLEPNSTTGGCWDGGILEISTNGGGSWTQVPAASLPVGPYRGAVSASGNPISNLQAWCGTTSYMRTIATLDSYAGQTVRFRLRLGSDSSVGAPGWSVDDVAVQSCVPANTLFVNGFEPGHPHWVGMPF